MGGTNCKETPRQRMISMMYLVLTALLALNVSKEILDAFVIVNDGLTKTTANFNEKNQSIYAELQNQATENPDKAKIWNDRAIEVKKGADDLFNEIDKLKEDILTTAGELESIKKEDDKLVIDGMAIGKKDNTDVPAQVMILQGGGDQLKTQIEGFKNHIISLVGETGKSEELEGSELIKAISGFLNTDVHFDEKKQEEIPWAVHHFENLPLMAVITIMSKIQGDIRNAEANTINFLLKQVAGDDIPFNKVQAIFVAEASDIIQGGTYKSEIFIAAYDSTCIPQIYIGDYDSLKYEPIGSEGKWLTDSSIRDGKGYYQVANAAVGTHNYKGFIKLKTPDGDKNYGFKAGYRIVPPSATVSATKMNVFYIGVPNPVKISAPGVQADQISASITNGSISPKGNGEYVVNVRGGQTCRVNVSGDIGGSSRTLGSEEFRIKKIPDPVPGVAGQPSGGRISTGALRTGTFVYAQKAAGFDFEANFRVTKFSVQIDDRGKTKSQATTGNAITGQQYALISTLRPGGSVVFTDIVAVGPDGDPRRLPPVVLKIQ